MKNLTKMMFALPLMLCAISACSSNAGKQDDGPVDVTLDSTYTADLSIMVPQSSEKETKMIEAVIDVFNLKYPNIKFNIKGVNVDAWTNTVRNQNIAGILPDIVWTNSPDFYFLIDSKIGLNLTPYVTASEEAGDFDYDSDFYTEYFDMGAKDGKLYCVPRSCDSVVTFYNKDLLTKAGIDMKDITNGWTWDTFMNKLELYRQYLDSIGQKNAFCADMNLTNWLSVNYPILASYGSEIIDRNLNIKIDSEETRTALEMVRSLVEKRYIPYPGEDSTNSFEAGTSPFLFQSAAISTFADTAILRGKIDIVSFPLIQDHATPKIGCGIAGYAINAKTKHRVACWQFLNTLISYDGQQAMASAGLNLPSVRKDLQDPAKANWMKGWTHLNLSAYTYGGELKITPEFLSWPDPRAKTGLDEAVRDLFYNVMRKDGTIENAIKLCVEAVEDALDY